MISEETRNKLTTIAENEQKVYDNGVADGKRAEYDAFWDALQNYGNRTEYSQAFRYTGFKRIEPKHSMANAVNVTGICMDLTSLEYIGDFRAPLATSWQNAFRYNSNLVEIGAIDMSGATNLNNAFIGCSKLAMMWVYGTINVSLNVAVSPLIVASLKSIVKHLKNYYGDANAYAYTLTVKASAWEALEAEGLTDEDWAWVEESFGIDREIFEDILYWATLVDSLRWNLVLA